MKLINRTKKMLIISFICALVVVAGFFWPFSLDKSVKIVESSSSHTMSITSNANLNNRCSSPQQSFCPMQVKFLPLVEHGYFPTILEQQQPVKMNCGASSALVSVCRGISAGTKLNVYSINIDGTVTYFGRNGYIAFFSNYENNFGPFNFSNDIASGSSIAMNFSNHNGSKYCNLIFDYSHSNWLLTTIDVN
jgi:hypothetical protein